jgi:predicted glycoside hydrolase/deacetylase ChbG (UPF0249 family)
MTRQLIVNADDFGRTHGVSLGIIRAHRDGIVTSTTAMMNMPGVTRDLHKAVEEAPKLGLGVHLNFTAGRPLMPVEWVKSLVDGHGRFLSQDAIMADPTRLDQDELKSELKSQIATFKNALGHLPDHLDAHHFVHLHPHLFGVYLDLADEFDVPVRIPFPHGETAADDEPPQLIDTVPRETIDAIVRADLQLLNDRLIHTTDRCILKYFGDHIRLDDLLNVLEALPDGLTELMTHPGLADEQLKAESSYYIQRERELDVLTHPQVLAHVQKLGIQLISFAALK